MKYLDIIDGQYPDWHIHAGCHPANGHSPDLWFPLTPQARPGQTRTQRRAQATAAAIAICNTCPVKAKCLDAALANEETDGIWGGVDFESGTRSPARCGTEAGYYRHRRDDNKPCDECTTAHRVATRARRAA